MKVLHLGKPAWFLDPLTKAQVRQGLHSACQASENECLDISEQPPHAIHFHSVECLLQPLSSEKSSERFFELLKEKNARVLFHDYGDLFLLQQSDDAALKRLLERIDLSVDHILLSRPDSWELMQDRKNWSWLPVPIDFNDIPRPPITEPGKEPVKILHIADRLCSGESHQIAQMLEELKNLKTNCLTAVFSTEQFGGQHSLLEQIKTCDVFVEQVARESYGVLALLAMAHGKTVISGNSPTMRERWHQLSLAPVLDTNQESLLRRIESLCKEPKSLRDLSKRSRLFVEEYHPVSLVARELLELYKRLFAP